MARRFGGKFSPRPSQDDPAADGPAGGGAADAGPGPYDGARVDPVGARANLLFIPPIPMVFMSLSGGAARLALALVAAGVLWSAAWLLREGLRAEAAYHARKVARRPAFPRKIAAGILTGIGAGLAARWSEPGMVAPVLYGFIAAGLHVAAFGPDPLRDKGMEGIDNFQRDRVARVVDEGEAHLRAMTEAIRRTGDRALEDRVAQFQRTARELFRTVEEDPRDLTQARRYMTVYLRGAGDATARFADIFARSRDAQVRADYLALLDDLEQNFAARTRKMLLDDRSDLTIEMEVLRERLQREGVRAD